MAEGVDDFALFTQLLYRLPLAAAPGASAASDASLERAQLLTHELALLLGLSEEEAQAMGAEAFLPLFHRCSTCGFATARSLVQAQLPQPQQQQQQQKQQQPQQEEEDIIRATCKCAACGAEGAAIDVSTMMQRTEGLSKHEVLSVLAAQSRKLSLNQPMLGAAALAMAGDVPLEAVIVHDAAMERLVVEELTRDAAGRPGLLELSGAARGDLLELYDEEAASHEGQAKTHTERRKKVRIATALATNTDTIQAITFKRPRYQHVQPIADAMQGSQDDTASLRRFNRVVASAKSRTLATSAAELDPAPQLLVACRRSGKKKATESPFKVYSDFRDGELLLYAKCPRTRVLYNAVKVSIPEELLTAVNVGDLNAAMPLLVKRAMEAYVQAANRPVCTLNMLTNEVRQGVWRAATNFMNRSHGERLQRLYGGVVSDPAYMYAVNGEQVTGALPSLANYFETLGPKAKIQNMKADLVCFHDPRISSKFLAEHGRWFTQTIARALPAVIEAIPPALLSLRISDDGRLYEPDGRLQKKSKREVKLSRMLTMPEGVVSDVVNHTIAVTDLLPPISTDDVVAITSELSQRCAMCLSRLTECTCVHDQSVRPLLSVNSRKRARMAFCSAYSADHPARQLLDGQEPEATLPINPYDLKPMRTFEELLASGSDKRKRKSLLDHAKGIDRYFAAPASRVPDAEPWTTGPSQDLLQYVNYMASQKAANAPELLGMFSESALLAVGVVVEELVRDLIARPTESHPQFLQADDEAVRQELMAQLRGAEVANPHFTPELVQNRLTAMFGTSVGQYENQIKAACIEAKRHGDYVVHPTSSSSSSMSEWASSVAGAGAQAWQGAEAKRPKTGMNAELSQASRGGYTVTRKEYRLGAATEAFASALVNTAAAFQVANDNDKQQEDKQQEDEQQEDEQQEDEEL